MASLKPLRLPTHHQNIPIELLLLLVVICKMIPFTLDESSFSGRRREGGGGGWEILSGFSF